MKIEEFTCYQCHKELLTYTTQEERDKERDILFPGLDKNEEAHVCRDCLIKIMAFHFVKNPHVWGLGEKLDRLISSC